MPFARGPHGNISGHSSVVIFKEHVLMLYHHNISCSYTMLYNYKKEDFYPFFKQKWQDGSFGKEKWNKKVGRGGIEHNLFESQGSLKYFPIDFVFLMGQLSCAYWFSYYSCQRSLCSGSCYIILFSYYIFPKKEFSWLLIGAKYSL